MDADRSADKVAAADAAKRKVAEALQKQKVKSPGGGVGFDPMGLSYDPPRRAMVWADRG